MEEIKKVDEFGAIRYYNEKGELHRDGDKPAFIHSNGTKEYWVNDNLHRDGDKPAVIHFWGTKEYWKNGVRYYPDEPKVKTPN